jgi:DNA (cytosine-5)-methyltransferase 1
LNAQQDKVRWTLGAGLSRAESRHADGAISDVKARVGQPLADNLTLVASINHAARGAVLTLVAAKAALPQQDIRYHQTRFDGGFEARRGFDAPVTVPFLLAHDLPTKAESHFLTYAVGQSAQLVPGTVLNIRPKTLAQPVIDAVNEYEIQFNELYANNAADAEAFAVDCVTLILHVLVEERANAFLALIRPRNLDVSRVVALFECHIGQAQAGGNARLPQLAAQAVYECLVPNAVIRYRGCKVEPISRLRAADRKAKTPGDVVVSTAADVHFEACETKYDRQVRLDTIHTIREKLKVTTVERYHVLSTLENPVDANGEEAIHEEVRSIKALYGCEVIISNLFNFIRSAALLLPSPDEICIRYADLLEEDEDATRENRERWNACCEGLIR